MVDAIMIGTRGWQHTTAEDDFYPEELPEDWRFCYYSNNLRSVLVPQEIWPTAEPAVVTQLLEDSDPAFRFILELPAGLSQARAPVEYRTELESFLEQCEPIAARITGYLLRIAAQPMLSIDWLENFLNRLVDIVPVCVDVPLGQRNEQVLAALARQGAGLCWRCDTDAGPVPGGRLRLALAAAGGARQTRQYLERLVQWQGTDAQAGLFFDAPAGAVKAAQEARLIAELMGI